MALVSLLALPLALSAGDVRVVPTPGVYATIQQAVDASVSGDTILVQSGAYPGFTIDGKGVRVLAAPDAVVQIQSTIVVRDTSVGEDVTLHGLHRPGGLNASHALRVAACDGHVLVSSCILTGGFSTMATETGGHGATIVDSQSVVVASSELLGGNGANFYDEDVDQGVSIGGSGLRAVSSNVAVYSSRLVGGDGGGVYEWATADGASGGSGLHAESSTVFVSSCEAVGGEGGVKGCEVFGGCGAGGQGGHGLALWSSTGEWRASTLTGGAGGDSPLYLQGLPFVAPGGTAIANLGPDVFHLAKSPVLPGEPVVLRFRAPAGHFALVALGFDALAPTPLLPGAGPLCVSPAGALLVPLGTVPPTGMASYVLPAPVASGLPVATTLHTQGVLLDPLAGTAHLADRSELTLVDGLP